MKKFALGLAIGYYCATPDTKLVRALRSLVVKLDAYNEKNKLGKYSS